MLGKIIKCFMNSWIRLAIVFVLLLIFCEYIIFYSTVLLCKWPEIRDQRKNDSFLKTLILADPHLLGKKKGNWFDKIRREWQMQMSFQSAVLWFEPEVVFILGDILDEGSFSPDDVYYEYIKTYTSLFKTPAGTELFVVAGNHDIGFHYAMNPYLERRFDKTFKTSSVRFLTRKGVHFVLINSMALEGDGCHLCKNAEDRIKYYSARLKCTKGKAKCYKGMKLESYSQPIILQHFPLYRPNDSNCSEPDEAPYREKYVKFKEGWDCLSKTSSNFLLDSLEPQAIFSGHTHHGCHTVHRGNISEYSVSSFNWRNKPNPSFLLVVFASDEYGISKCYVPNEYLVILIYILGLLGTAIYNVYAI